jgi:hypothetical protein
MNRKILLAILLIGMVTAVKSYGQVTYIGAAGHYGTAITEFGVGANAIYTINEKIDFTPNFVYYFLNEVPSEEGEGVVTNKWWSANLDGHYIPVETSLFQAYGLMGLNLTSMRGRYDYTINNQRFEGSLTPMQKLGLNFGGGIQLKLGEKLAPFAEAKYTLGEADQLVFSFGILFRIKEDKVRDNTEDF